MRTDYKQIVYDKAFGVDSTTKPLHVGADKWTVLHNLRAVNGTLGQIPPLTVFDGTNITGHAHPIQEILAIPVGSANRCLIVLLTRARAYQLGTTIAASVPLDHTVASGGQPDVSFSFLAVNVSDSSLQFLVDGVPVHRGTGELLITVVGGSYTVRYVPTVDWLPGSTHAVELRYTTIETSEDRVIYLADVPGFFHPLSEQLIIPPFGIDWELVKNSIRVKATIKTSQELTAVGFVFYPAVTHTGDRTILVDNTPVFQQFGFGGALAGIIQYEITITVPGTQTPVSIKQTHTVGQTTSATEFEYNAQIYRRWATAAYNGQVFFTNEFNTLRSTEGTRIRKANGELPKARYLATFFDHAVVGWVSFKGAITPARVQWSHLYDFDQWEPKPENEADFFDVSEWCRTDLPMMGVTGIAQIGDNLAIFTPSAIIKMSYTGIQGGQKGMLFQTWVRDVGNGLMYGMVAYRNTCFFYDMNEKNFFAFDGQQVKAIGDDIVDYFHANIIQNDFDGVQRTWAYVNPELSEVGWVFPSQSAQFYEKAIAYNWKTERWHTKSVDDVHAMGLGNGICRVVTCDELTSTIDSKSRSADELGGVSLTMLPRAYGSQATDATLRREVISGDVDGVVRPQDTPVMETGDRTFGDLALVKEIDTIVIHGKFTTTTGGGIQVSISTRNHVDDAISYVPIAQLWTPNLPERRLSFPRKSGRIFRFKFEFVGTTPPRGGEWSAYVENVRGDFPEK